MWKIIPFEPNYEVSNLGEIRNVQTKQIKKLRLERNGYLRVTLYPSWKTYNIHRIVALVFLERPSEDYVVNHKDGVKTNNNVINLEWVTESENCKHAYKNKLSKNRPKGARTLVPEELVKRIRYGDLKGVCKYELSKTFGFHWVTFRDIINNKTYKKI